MYVLCISQEPFIQSASHWCIAGNPRMCKFSANWTLSTFNINKLLLNKLQFQRRARPVWNRHVLNGHCTTWNQKQQLLEVNITYVYVWIFYVWEYTVLCMLMWLLHIHTRHQYVRFPEHLRSDACQGEYILAGFVVQVWLEAAFWGYYPSRWIIKDSVNITHALSWQGDICHKVGAKGWKGLIFVTDFVLFELKSFFLERTKCALVLIQFKNISRKNRAVIFIERRLAG